MALIFLFACKDKYLNIEVSGIGYKNSYTRCVSKAFKELRDRD